MAAVPVGQSPAASQALIGERFQQLAAHWRAETGHLSSATALMNHPAFQEILGLGGEVVPLMLAELAKGPSLWVWALPTLAGADPVSVEDRGKIARMTEAWLAWGKANGYSC
jgi:hypothetical protein